MSAARRRKQVSLGSRIKKRACPALVLAIAVAVTVAPLAAQSTLQVPASESPQSSVFKSDVREVSVVFRVVGKDNELISGITPADIQVDDQGVLRKITSFRGDVAHSQV